MHAAKLLEDAQRAFRSGDAAHAERLLKRVLTSDPASTKANELLAYILGNRGDLEGAQRAQGRQPARRLGAGPGRSGTAPGTGQRQR